MSETAKSWTKWSSSLFWVAILAVAAYFIVGHLGVVGNALVALIGFGAVVLVHEFGHFITAKLGGIRVEAFSIFMPPTLLGIRKTKAGFKFRVLPSFSGRKEEEAPETEEEDEATEYRIGLFPFGGYVKLLGQEDTGPVKQIQDPRSFAKKPMPIRMAVIAAGVTFNVISAAIIFMVVFLVGINLPPAVVGGVLPNSPAAEAGLQPGDKFVKINDKSEDLDFSDIMIAAALSGYHEKVPVTVERPNGSLFETTLVAKNLGRSFREFGIAEPLSLAIAQVSEPNVLKERTSLLPGDRIVAVNGEKVEHYWQFDQVVEHTLKPAVEITADRKTDDNEQIVHTRLPLDWAAAQNGEVPTEADLANVYSMVPRLRVMGVNGEDGFASSTNDQDSQATRLMVGDIIVAADGTQDPTYRELREITTAHEGELLPLTVLRTDVNNVEHTLTVTVKPRRAPGENRVIIGFIPALDAEHTVVAKAISTGENPTALDIPRGARIVSVNGKPVSNFFDVIAEVQRWQGQSVALQYRLDDGAVEGGVTLPPALTKGPVAVASLLGEPVPFKPLDHLYRASNPLDAITMGYHRTLGFIAQTYVTLAGLLRGLISPDNLMGPLGIITLSYRIVAEQPLVNYAYFLGLISATIAVMNFLPLPPFDGGLIVLMLIEKIKGSALTERTQGIVAYAGWMLVLALLVYVTFNDIVRSFFNS